MSYLVFRITVFTSGGCATERPTPRELLAEALGTLDKPLDFETTERLEDLAQSAPGASRVAAIRNALKGHA